MANKVAFLIDFDGVIGNDELRFKAAKEGIVKTPSITHAIKVRLKDHPPIALEGKSKTFIDNLARFLINDKDIREQLQQAKIMKEGTGASSSGGRAFTGEREGGSVDFLGPLEEPIVDLMRDYAQDRTKIDVVQASEYFNQQVSILLGVDNNPGIEPEIQRRMYEGEVADLFINARNEVKNETGGEKISETLARFGDKLVAGGYVPPYVPFNSNHEWRSAWMWGGLGDIKDVVDGVWKNKEQFTYPGGVEMVKKLQEMGQPIIWTEGVVEYQTIKLMLAGIAPNHQFFEPYPKGPYSHPRPHQLGYIDLERELAKPDRSENEPLFLISTDKNRHHGSGGGTGRFSISPIQEITNVLPRYGFDTVAVIDDKSANCDKVVNAITPMEGSKLKVVPVWVRQGDHVNKAPKDMTVDEAKVKYNAVDAVSQVPQKVQQLLNRTG